MQTHSAGSGFCSYEPCHDFSLEIGNLKEASVYLDLFLKALAQSAWQITFSLYLPSEVNQADEFICQVEEQQQQALPASQDSRDTGRHFQALCCFRSPRINTDDSPWISWANFSIKELDLFIGMYVASYFTSVQDKPVDSSLCTHHKDSIWVQDITTKTAESLMCPFIGVPSFRWHFHLGSMGLRKGDVYRTPNKDHVEFAVAGSVTFLLQSLLVPSRSLCQRICMSFLSPPSPAPSFSICSGEEEV